MQYKYFDPPPPPPIPEKLADTNVNLHVGINIYVLLDSVDS